MAEGGGVTNVTLTRRDAVYAAVLAATVGGSQIVDSHRAPNLEVITARIEAVEKGLQELRDPGGPVLRETAGKVRALEAGHNEVNRALKDLQDARYNDLRNGVSQEAINDLRQRLTDQKDADRELKTQIEALRSAIDSLRSEILRQTTMRLRGPDR